MFNKLAITTLVIMGTAAYAPAHADDSYSSCAVEVAVASSHIKSNESVVFNVSNERGTNRSITMKSGDAPKMFGYLICSSIPYNITATLYSSTTNAPLHTTQGIGQCTLKAGLVILNEAYNSVSVVFPNDFYCD